MRQSFSHRSAFERQPRTRLIIERNERQAYQAMSDSVVRQKPMVPDYSKPVGYVLIALAVGIGAAELVAWAVFRLATM